MTPFGAVMRGQVTSPGRKEAYMSNKVEAVRRYEKSAPMKLKAYVVNVCGYKSCESWSFEELADEFGFGYMLYMEEERKKLMEN